MISTSAGPALSADSPIALPLEFRRQAAGEEPTIFTDIYKEDINIAIWRRQLSQELTSSVEDFLTVNPKFQSAMTLTPQSALEGISESLGLTCDSKLSQDIAGLVDMFCCLFDLARAGLRLTILDRAMCPKFHTDKVPCRLVTTYQGSATQWLTHQLVDREKLGAGSNGQADSSSGLYSYQGDIQHLSCGDVGLLKGEAWEGNENAGLVHRSPALQVGERRLLLTLDFSG